MKFEKFVTCFKGILNPFTGKQPKTDTQVLVFFKFFLILFDGKYLKIKLKFMINMCK